MEHNLQSKLGDLGQNRTHIEESVAKFKVMRESGEISGNRIDVSTLSASTSTSTSMSTSMLGDTVCEARTLRVIDSRVARSGCLGLMQLQF
jgi:hypothetical protein